MTMPARRISRAVCLALAFLSAAIFCSARSSDAGKRHAREGEAVVKTDSVGVSSDPSASGKVTRSLKKGAVVTVEIEMQGAEGTWCGIVEQGQRSISGYVPCRYLERNIPGVTWKAVGRRTTAKDFSPAEVKKVAATEKTKRPYADVTVLLYMTTW